MILKFLPGGSALAIGLSVAATTPIAIVAPESQKHNQPEIKIASAVDRWIQTYWSVRFG